MGGTQFARYFFPPTPATSDVAFAVSAICRAHPPQCVWSISTWNSIKSLRYRLQKIHHRHPSSAKEVFGRRVDISVIACVVDWWTDRSRHRYSGSHPNTFFKNPAAPEASNCCSIKVSLSSLSRSGLYCSSIVNNSIVINQSNQSTLVNSTSAWNSLNF